jgi:VCBS repeat-containing protein
MKTSYLTVKIGVVALLVSSLSACFSDDNNDDMPIVNMAPVAQSLNIVTQTETAVMGNLTASDPENDVLTFTIGSETELGSITVNTDGSYTYQPFNEKVGNDVFTYNVSDTSGNSAMGTVSIEIEMLQVSFRQFTRDVFAGEPTDQAITLNGKVFIQDSTDQIDFQDLVDNN